MTVIQELRADVSRLKGLVASQLTTEDVVVDTVEPLVLTMPDGSSFEGAAPLGVKPIAGRAATLLVGEGRAWLMPRVEEGDLGPGEISPELAGQLAKLDLAREMAHEQIIDAQNQADRGREDAAAAHSLASEASQTATDAHNAAVAATQDVAELAAKKHVVIAAEPPQDPTEETLWIDVNDGQPYRWDGSAWVVITDTRITAAAQAAAAAQSAAEQAQTAASNADQKAQAALVSANGRNSRVTSTSAPSGTENPNTGQPWVDDDVWIQWDSTSARNAIGQWVRRDGAWRAEMITSQVITNLDVNKLVVLGSARMTQAVVNKIIGDAGFFKLLTADRIAVVASDGVYYDGSFQDAGLSAVRAANSGFAYVPATQSMTGSGRLWLTRNAEDEGASTPLEAGRTYAVRIVGTGLSSYTLARRDSSGSYVFVSETTHTADGIEAVVKVANPGTRFELYQQGSGTATVTRVSITEAAGGTLIEPGGIWSEHIATDALNFKEALGLKLTSPEIQTDTAATTGIKIIGNTFRAYGSGSSPLIDINGSTGTIRGVNIIGVAITGSSTITGATLQSVTTASRGVKIQGDNVRIWSNVGRKMVDLSPTALEVNELTFPNGGNIYGGYVDPNGSSSTMYGYVGMGKANSTVTQVSGVQVWNDQVVLNSFTYPASTGSTMSLDRSGAIEADANTRLRFSRGGNNVLEATNATTRLSYGSSAIAIAGGIDLSPSGTARLELRDSGSIYQTSNWQQFTITGPASTRNTWVIRPVTAGGINRAMLGFSGGNAQMAQTTIASNLYMDNGGWLYVTSSSRRNKVDVQDITTPPELILDLPVRDWFDRAEAEGYAAYLDGDEDEYVSELPFRRVPGVVAEELEEAGLEQFVTYDAAGQTTGVMYERLTLLLIPLVRDLRDRITQLEAQHA